MLRKQLERVLLVSKSKWTTSPGFYAVFWTTSELEYLDFPLDKVQRVPLKDRPHACILSVPRLHYLNPHNNGRNQREGAEWICRHKCLHQASE